MFLKLSGGDFPHSNCVELGLKFQEITSNLFHMNSADFSKGTTFVNQFLSVRISEVFLTFRNY